MGLAGIADAVAAFSLVWAVLRAAGMGLAGIADAVAAFSLALAGATSRCNGKARYGRQGCKGSKGLHWLVPPGLDLGCGHGRKGGRFCDLLCDKRPLLKRVLTLSFP